MPDPSVRKQNLQYPKSMFLTNNSRGHAWLGTLSSFINQLTINKSIFNKSIFSNNQSVKNNERPTLTNYLSSSEERLYL